MYTKEQAIVIVTAAAKEYKECLSGKNFCLFVWIRLKKYLIWKCNLLSQDFCI